jgi:hypothetical protein
MFEKMRDTYSHIRATPLIHLIENLSTNISVLRTFFIYRNIDLITLGAEPRYVYRKMWTKNTKHRRCDTYPHVRATHLIRLHENYSTNILVLRTFFIYRNIDLITLGASPRYVCRKRKQRIEHRRCDTYSRVRATHLVHLFENYSTNVSVLRTF